MTTNETTIGIITSYSVESICTVGELDEYLAGQS